MYKPQGNAHAIKAGNTIYLSGQAGFDKKFKLVGKDDPVAQFEQACKNMKRVLEAADAGIEHIVKVTFYVKKIDDLYKAYPVIAKYFPGTDYASLGIEVKGFADPDMLVEMDVIAVVD